MQPDTTPGPRPTTPAEPGPPTTQAIPADPVERAVAALLARQDGLITREQAVAAGLPAAAVDERVRLRRWRPLQPRVYLARGDSTDPASTARGPAQSSAARSRVAASTPSASSPPSSPPPAPPRAR